MSDADGITTEVERDSVSATGVVDAPPAAVFDYLRRPANHPEINGDNTVKGTTTGPESLGLGDRFGMKMRLGAPYRTRNKVVEFEPDHLIAWCHFAGHRWRWELEPVGDGRTKLTETFDLSTARFPPALRVAGYPKGHATNVTASVRNVIAHFGSVSAST